MNEYERIYTDLRAIFTLQLKEFYRQYKLSHSDPSPLLTEEVEDFLVTKINNGLEDLHDNKNALDVAVSVFMTMLINNIEAEFSEKP